MTDTLVVANRIELESHVELARDFLGFLATTVLDLQAEQREQP